MPTVPDFFELPSAVPVSAAVLELPLGNVGPDIAAVYRAIGHGHRVVNGYSGYEPPHYRAVRLGLEARDDSVLTELTAFAPLAVFVTRDDPGGNWIAFVEQHAGAVHVEHSPAYDLFLLPAATPRNDPPLAAALTIRRATSNVPRFDVKTVTDHDVKTAWSTPGPQRGDEEIVFELERISLVSGISLATGPAVQNYPRAIGISTSLDGRDWHELWSGGMAGAALDAVLKNPAVVESHVRLTPTAARFVRLRELRPHHENPWTLAELTIHGVPLAHS
jgi:hypothetical protein